MDIGQLADDEVLVAARAASIHRVSLRRKLGRLKADSSEYTRTLSEIEVTQRLMDKLNVNDFARLTADG
jgi:hypothetical protein